MVRGRLPLLVLLVGAALVARGDAPPAPGPVPAGEARDAAASPTLLEALRRARPHVPTEDHVPPGEGEIRRVRPSLLPDPPRWNHDDLSGPWDDLGSR